MVSRGYSGERALALSAPTTEYIVLFELDAAELDEGAHQVVDHVINEWRTTLAAGASLTASVTGHADTSGPEGYNMELSRRRAEAVHDALIAGGFDPNAITIAASGEREPMVPTPDGVEEAGNRRVNIKLE